VHFPFAKQEENVAALLVYSPNSDLQLFSKDNLYVTLIWPESSFSETSTEQGNWIVAREDSTYIAMYRSCLDVNADGFSSCSAAKQVYGLVLLVGHQDIPGSFDEFLAVIEGATVQESFDGGSMSASVQVNGRNIAIECHMDQQSFLLLME
jgi:hypothetical protein